MVVPTAERDLNEPGPEVSLEQIARRDAGIAESGIAITVLLGLTEIENVIDSAVVHHEPRAHVPVAHLGGARPDVVEVAHFGVDVLQQSVARPKAGSSIAMRGIRQRGTGVGQERRILGRQVARSGGGLYDESDKGRQSLFRSLVAF